MSLADNYAMVEPAAHEIILDAEEVQAFHTDGYAILRGFYDLQSDIVPIQLGVYQILGLLIDKYGLDIDRPAFHPETFDAGYQPLIAANRKYGAEVYDAVKQIPAFVRLAAHPKHEAIMRQLRDDSQPGLCGNGYGIRIDNPGEERFRAPWHQDYPAQFRSIDGLVFWSPLAAVTREMGPVEVCVGSHVEGLIRVHTKDPKNPEKTGAYGLILENQDEIIARYEHVAPLSQPGDLLVFDFLTVHRSGANVAKRSRWSMQNRYFNFANPLGQKINWAGAYGAGNDVKSVHPDLFID